VSLRFKHMILVQYGVQLGAASSLESIVRVWVFYPGTAHNNFRKPVRVVIRATFQLGRFILVTYSKLKLEPRGHWRFQVTAINPLLWSTRSRSEYFLLGPDESGLSISIRGTLVVDDNMQENC